jgi:hypothetical protein
MNFIEHLVEPERLLLVWQAPDGDKRTRLAVGELLRRDDEVTFRYLTNSEDFTLASELGFICYPAFRKTDREYTLGVMDTFMRRLPPRKRGDFSRYLEQWRLSPESSPSDFALLAYSGAKLPNDGFSVDWPLAEVKAPCELLLEVAGFRYRDDVNIEDLSEGMPALLSLEDDNPVDAKAVAIEVAGKCIGYVKRSQRDAVLHWLNCYEVEAEIERLNGTPERPLVYLFCRIRQDGSSIVPIQAMG